MTMRSKILFITCGTVIGLLFAIYFASSSIFLRSHARLEVRQTVCNVERVLAALHDSLDKLGVLVHDWSAWDDMYQFANDRNKAFVQTNLGDGTFNNAKLNLILVLDPNGHYVHGKSYDLENEIEVPFPRELDDFVQTHRSLWQFSDVDGNLEGVVALPSGLLLIASRHILSSNDKGPSHGTLTMGRWLNTPMIDHISSVTQLTIAVG
ncbi:MAG: CHASE4 domain-containing protein, partial [FCB group bacterium]|nr:CHASE4 domain-containing protein [FCB group bacterium]